MAEHPNDDVRPSGRGPVRAQGGRPADGAEAEHVKLRRIAVERLELAGASRRKIAEAVGVTVGTVGADLKAIREERRAAFGGQTVVEERDLELARLEAQRLEVEQDQSPGDPANGIPAGPHNLSAWQAHRLRLAIATRKARLLGLDAPQFIEMSTVSGEEGIEGTEEAQRAPTLAEALGVQGDAADVAKVVYLQMKGRQAG